MTFIEIFIDKLTLIKKNEANKSNRTVVNKRERSQDAVRGPNILLDHNLFPPNPLSSACSFLRSTPRAPQARIAATDRRLIEARNEYKSHTTKETLDDIKRVYQKEKKKKEENIIEPHQTGMGSSGLVSETMNLQENPFIFPL